MVIIIFDIPLHNVTQKVQYIFFFKKVFLSSVSTHTIIKHNSFECLYLFEFEWEGEGGGHLFEAGCSRTFSAFRVGSY